MNLVEAVEKTLSLALNFSSSINQSLLWDRGNLGKNIKEPYTQIVMRITYWLMNQELKTCLAYS